MYKSSYEQLILNLLSPITVQVKDRPYLTVHTLELTSHDKPKDLFPASALPRGWSGGNLSSALLPPIFHVGWVWGCGRLGPPFSLVFANERVGEGGEERPLTNDKSHLSYILSFMFPGPFIPNFGLYLTLTVIALANSFHPVPTPHSCPPAAGGSSCPASYGSPGRMRSSGT
jgi:hypothetical protein